MTSNSSAQWHRCGGLECPVAMEQRPVGLCFERPVPPEQLFRAPSGSGATVSNARWLQSSSFERPVALEQLFRVPRDSREGVSERPGTPENASRSAQGSVTAASGSGAGVSERPGLRSSGFERLRSVFVAPGVTKAHKLPKALWRRTRIFV